MRSRHQKSLRSGRVMTQRPGLRADCVREDLRWIMAFDWSLVVGSVVGAAIGLAGEWSGRLGSRRQAERARQQTLEDAEGARVVQREDDRQRGIENREIQALQRVLAALVNLPGVTEAKQRRAEVAPSVIEVVLVIAEASQYVRSTELRARISGSIDALEGAALGLLETFDLGECIYTVRHVLRGSIGSYLRGEHALPGVSTDWSRLMSERTASKACDVRATTPQARSTISAASDSDSTDQPKVKSEGPRSPLHSAARHCQS
jgi:hypothetical protein